jgi:hypothetical protein
MSNEILFFFSFIARNFSTSFFSIFQVQDDGADGTHGFAMVHSVIALSDDPSDLSWFSLGLRLLWFRVLHGSAALPPISSLFYSSVQFHDDGYEDTLGLITVFFVVARAADATWHGSGALPPIQYCKALWTHHAFLHSELTTVFFVVARAADATWHGSGALPPIHYGPSSCCDLTWLYRVATNLFIHSFIHFFSFHFSPSFKYPMTGPMVPLESSRFSLWLRMLQRPILIEREWIVLNEVSKRRKKKKKKRNIAAATINQRRRVIAANVGVEKYK